MIYLICSKCVYFHEASRLSGFIPALKKPGSREKRKLQPSEQQPQGQGIQGMTYCQTHAGDPNDQECLAAILQTRHASFSNTHRRPQRCGMPSRHIAHKACLTAKHTQDPNGKTHALTPYWIELSVESAEEPRQSQIIWPKKDTQGTAPLL